MPLIMASENILYKISRIKGNDEVLARLKNLGFVIDAPITILQKTDGGLIVKLFDARLALDVKLASKIEVSEV